jgi:nucleotide-binding universal stress UspA family protein
MVTLKSLLVATDFSESSEAAFLYGREFAARFGATLHVLHVAPNILIGNLAAENYFASAPELQKEVEDDARRQLHQMLVDTDRGGPASISAVLTAGSPAAAILEYAKDHEIDLIVMGTHGRGALAHLVMGSVAEQVVRLAPCPVLTVRHPERDFVRPDTLATVAPAS